MIKWFALAVVFTCIGFCPMRADAERPVVQTKPLHERPVLTATKRFKRKMALVNDRNADRTINYYWYAPSPPYPEGVEFPLVVILHGGTGYSYAGKYLTNSEVQMKYPAFVLVPMIPEHAIWSFPEPTSNKQELPNVVKLIKQLSKKYPIDKRRIYILGCSMGGYGVFGASSFYDHVFAAGISISGSWEPLQAKQMTKMPLLVMAGSRDTAVKTSDTRAVVTALKSVNAPVQSVEYDMGHYCPAPHFYSEKVWKWLFQHKMK